MELLYYFLKVSTCTMLFFGFYLLVLRKLTFFRINRFYLLFTLIISFIIPTLHFTVERELSQSPIISTAQFPPDAEISGIGYQTPILVGNEPALEEGFDYYLVLPYLYFGVVAGLLLFASWRLLQLVKHTRNSVEEVNGLKIVPKAKGFTNCSFFNYVFIDEKSLTETELNILLKHEEVHAKQLHSIDKIILMILKAVLWFNPIVYFYDKALEEAHEYEADEATSKNFGTPEYAGLLLRLAISKSEMPLVHNFVKSPIKARIKMLFNSKSRDMKKLMYLLALPIGLGLLWGFTVKVVAVTRSPKPTKEIKVAKKTTLNRHLFGKTLKGRIKSILQTEVGEILNFKYNETTIEIFNFPKGKIKVGEELLVTINGTVDDITVKDSKGNVIKKLDRPCYGMSKLSRLNGDVLYELTTPAIKNQSSPKALNPQDVPKREKKKELALPNKKQTNPYFKSAVYQEQSKKAASLSGKTLTGTIGADLTPVKNDVFSFNGKYFKVGKETFILTAYPKDNTSFKSLRENDKVSVQVDNVGFSEKSAYMQIGAKSISKAGVVVFVRPDPEKYPFLYEANRVRFNDPVITTISNVANGLVLKLKQNGFDFTVNINKAQTDDADYIKSLKVGDVVRLRFVHEVKKAATSYLINDWISISKNIRTYGLQNESLFYKFYNKDGSQKVATNTRVSSQKSDIKGSNVIPKPTLISSSTMHVDTKNDITYIKNGLMEIGEVKLEAEDITWDTNNGIITAKIATIKTKNGDKIVSKSIIYDVKKGTYKAIAASGNVVKRPSTPSLYVVNKSSQIEHPTISAAYELLKRLKANNDSLKVNLIMDRTLTVSGNVKLKIDGYALNGKVLQVEKDSNLIKAHMATFTDKNGYKVSGDVIEFDLISKNYKVTQPVGAAYMKY